MVTYYIYTLIQDGYAFYVGKTMHTEKRHDAHKKSFGESVELAVIDSIDCEYADRASDELELFYIDLFRQYGFKLRNAVGNLNYKRKPAVRAKKCLKNDLPDYSCQLLKPSDVCELLGVSNEELKKLVSNGVVNQPIRFTSHTVRYRMSDISQFINKN